MLSYRKNADLIQLKQKWALSLLKAFNIELNVIGRHSSNKSLVFIGNHISFLDIIVLLAAEPKIVFLSKAEVKRWPIIGAGAVRMGTLFVSRESTESRAQSKRALQELLSNKSNSIYLAGFPSGTTAIKENLRWKRGLFEVAQNTETEVQSFKFNYSPLRVCAYIDEDTLFTSMMGLFKTENKRVCLEWGESQKIVNLAEQMDSFQEWTQFEQNRNEEKTEI